MTETVARLAARAPKLRRVLDQARQAGHAYLVIDGTLIPIDRVAADRPFYSGKHRRHEMNLHVMSSPDGEIVWVSGPLPGAGEHVRIPYKGKNKPAAQNDANRAHARLRGPGERANAQPKSWRILRKLRCCPWKAGQLAKAIRVL